jgi:cell division protein FtsB
MRARIIWGIVIIGALVFALQAGEYSTLDIMRQRQRISQLSTSTDSLARLVDSLTRVEKLVRTDTATQERIAREEFGMVRGNEILYRFYTDSADTTGR